jgi:hypothetical protein
MIALADIRHGGHGLYCREVLCPACGALLGKTFAMIGRQLAENYEKVRLAAILTAQACPSGCNGERSGREPLTWRSRSSATRNPRRDGKRPRQ